MDNTFVLKYGGTSVATTVRIEHIARQLMARADKGQKLVVVVSAMGKTTDQLVELAQNITERPDERDMDMLMATGEQVSIALLSMAIKVAGGKAVSYTGHQVGILTCDTHTRARIKDVDTSKLESSLNDGSIVVVAGFQGVAENGDITTLGRGGSDTTAVSLAAKLNCPCEIYTDVDGVYSVDPRVYPEAQKLATISYEEMLEMASLGANVLETRAVELASKYKVPIYVALSTGDYPGTTIKELDANMEKKMVTGMTIEENCLMVSLNRIPFESKNIAGIFAKMAQERIFIDMISQTAPYDGFVNVSFSTYEDDKHKVKDAIESLQAEFPTLDYLLDDSIIKVSVVGIGMMSASGVAADMFQLFAENNIDFYQVTTSEISISYTVDSGDRDKAVAAIAQHFNL